MSTPESVPAGTVSLEDDAPTPQPEAVAAPAAPAPENAPEPAAAEVEAVEVGGQKYVPLAAVLAERAEKKALKERAGKADQLEQWVNQARPYVEFMQQNPELLKRPPAPAPAAPTVDPELVELAETLSLYKPDGTPDVDKASRVAQFTERRAKRESQQAIEPWARSTAEQQSARNYHAVVNATAPNGVKPDPAVIQNLWRQLPANLTADPQVATLVQLMATGAAAMNQRPAIAPPPNAPLVTEGAGGHPQTRPLLSATERNVAAAKGISETAFADLGKGYKPGRTSSLED